jgi:hypothetical protein
VLERSKSSKVGLSLVPTSKALGFLGFYQGTNVGAGSPKALLIPKTTLSSP